MPEYFDAHPWTLWLIAGVVMLAFEAITPGGMFMLLMGAAAIMMAIAKGLGLNGPFQIEFMIYAALCTALIVFLRKRIQQAFTGTPPPDASESWAGESSSLSKTLARGEKARATLRGTTWTVRNDGDRDIPANEPFMVIGQDSIVLSVKAKEPAQPTQTSKENA